MIAGQPSGGIWLATAPADMRMSFDGLSALVRTRLGRDPVSGAWCVFINRRRTMKKVLASIGNCEQETGAGRGGFQIVRALVGIRPFAGQLPQRAIPSSAT